MLKTCLLKCAEAKLRKSSIESIATRLCDEALLSMSDERKVLQDVPSPVRVSFDVLIVNGCPFFLENLDKLGGFKDGRGKSGRKKKVGRTVMAFVLSGKVVLSQQLLTRLFYVRLKELQFPVPVCAKKFRFFPVFNCCIPFGRIAWKVPELILSGKRQQRKLLILCVL